MRTRFDPKHRRHPRVEVICPPLRWSAVGRRIVYASATIAASSITAAGFILYSRHTGDRAFAWFGAAFVALAALSLGWLTHLINAVRLPITFRIVSGELIVTKPFLIFRKTRRLKTSDVRAVTVSGERDMSDGRPTTGRLSLRRKYRLPLRVPGRRPIHELDRVAEELRAALRV